MRSGALGYPDEVYRRIRQMEGQILGESFLTLALDLGVNAIPATLGR